MAHAGGRPKFEINYSVVEAMASVMATQEEIASALGCNVRTLQRDEEFCRIFKEGVDKGKISLRRKQFKLADKSSAMAIFLGKNYLGQKDNLELIDNREINQQIQNIADLINKPRKVRTEKDLDDE